MAKKRHRGDAGKREPGGFVAVPHAVIRSPEWAALSPRAVKLLCDLLAQFRGDNNGDLCASMTLMQGRGWRSKEGLSAALMELEHGRFIVRTRQGGRHKATLYAVTFREVDWCAGKLDIEAPSRKYMGMWRGTLSAPPVGQIPNNCPASGVIEATAKLNCPAGRPNQAVFPHSIAPPAGTSIDLPLPAERISMGAHSGQN